MTIFPLSRRRPAGGSGGAIPPGTYATPQDVTDAIADAAGDYATDTALSDLAGVVAGKQDAGDYPTVADVEAAIAAAAPGAAYKSAALVLRSTYAAGVTVNPDGFVPFGITELNDANGILGLDVSNGVANAAIKNLTNGYVLIDFAVTGVLTLNPGDTIPLIDYINDYEANPGNPGNYGYQVGIEAADLTVPRRQILKPGGTLAIVCEPIAMMQVMVKAYTTEQIAIEVATGVPRSGFMKLNTNYLSGADDPNANMSELFGVVGFDGVAIDRSNGLIALQDSIYEGTNNAITNVSGVPLIIEVSVSQLIFGAGYSDSYITMTWFGSGPSESVDGTDLQIRTSSFGESSADGAPDPAAVRRLELPDGYSLQFQSNSGAPVVFMQVMIKATAY